MDRRENRPPASSADPEQGNLADLACPEQGRTAPIHALTGESPARQSTSHLLTGDLRFTVWHLALPVLLEQFLNFCVGTYDMWLSGHLPDESITTSATSAVGVAAYVGWLASMLFSLVAAGTTALVARHWGAGQFTDARRITNRSLALALTAGIGFLILIWPGAPLFSFLLDLEPKAAEITTHYLRLDGIGLVFTALSLVGAAALRGTGDMRTPMFVLGTVSVLNIIVSTILVYGLGPIAPLGVDGIVLGTVSARFAGGLLMMLWLRFGSRILAIELSQWKLRGETARRILRIGLPAAIDGMIMWSGHFLFLRIISEAGATALATHMIGIRVEAITYLPAVAWGAAAATLVGQSLGNQDPQRARRAGHTAVWQCGLLGILITLAFFAGSERIFSFMHNDPQVRETGASAFRTVALFQIPLIISIVYVAGLRGAGETRFPLVMTVFSTIGLRIPLAWLLCLGLGWGLYGAWLAMCVDMFIRAVMSAWKFARGDWVETKV